MGVQSWRNLLRQNMKLTKITFIVCCFFFFLAPIDGSFYLIKVADDKPNSTDEQILHNEPKEKDDGGEGGQTETNKNKDVLHHVHHHVHHVAEAEKSLATPAKPDDRKHAGLRVSHSSFSQTSLKKRPKDADADTKIDYHAFSWETDDDQELEEKEGEKVGGQLEEGKTDGDESVSVIFRGAGNDYGEATCQAELKVKPCQSKSKRQCGNGQIKCKKGSGKEGICCGGCCRKRYMKVDFHGSKHTCKAFCAGRAH